MKYILEFLHFFGSILLANIEIKFPKIYSFIYSILVGLFEIKLICFFNKIILTLKYLIKFFLFSIFFLTFLVLFVSFSEFVILLVLNFTIGLKESFSNSNIAGKFYLFDLYIILFYSFVKRKYISSKAYKYIEIFKNKYFNSKDKENVEKYRGVVLFFGVYFSICLVGLSFYQLNGNDWSKDNKADIINIFIWATYLITPIVAIWVFSDWRIQKKYEVNKETSLNLLTVILEIENCLEELMAITTEFRCLKNDDEHIFFGKKCDVLSLRFVDLINKLKSNNNLHHGLVRGFKGDKIIPLEMLNNIDSFFQSLCDMVFEINDNYISNIESKKNAEKFLKDKIKAVGENQILYRDSFSPIKELLSEECQPHKKVL